MNLKHMQADNFSKESDSRLKLYAFQILSVASIPMEQWFNVFSNPELLQRTGLRCKAFYVWFPCMIDFVEKESLINKLYEEIDRRGLDVSKVKDLTYCLLELFKDVLDNYSKDEQIFLYDRRLQNTHGFLNVYLSSKITIRWYDRKVIRKQTLSADEYHDLNRNLYINMTKKSLELLERFITTKVTESGYNLMKYHGENLTSEKLMVIGEGIGVIK